MPFRHHHATVHGQHLLELILTALNDVVEYELAVILTLNDRNVLRVEQAMGPLAGERLTAFEIDLARRADLSRIISSSTPHLFSQAEHHVDIYHEVLDLPEGHSCLVAPMHVDGEPIGMLTLDHRGCDMFSPGVVRFIGTLARLIAIIIAQRDSSELLLSEQRALTEERNRLLDRGDDAFRKLVGSSPAWEQVLESVRIVAGSDLAVLIQGETGSGKEQIARSIHRLSSRRNAPFIALNCSVLSGGLADSELFGHEKGAFTSAVSRRKGRFELANGGTLFLDEVGDLPAEVQPKLLRALQEGTYERVGGEQTVHTDVRVITASNIDLRAAVRDGRFREDLYYRLSVFPIVLPPLRDRLDDVVLLAEHFLARLRTQPGYESLRLGAPAVECLLRHRWPGNVRELQNVIRRAALVAGGGRIEPEHLALRTTRGGSGIDPHASRPVGSMVGVAPLAGGLAARAPDDPVAPLDDVIAAHIRRALAAARGRIYGESGAAAMLGLKPTTLQSRMERLGIIRDEFR